MEKLILQLQMLQMLFPLDDFLKSSHQQSNVKICSAARRTVCNTISLAPIQALAANAGNVHQGGLIEYDDDHNSSDHVICSWHCEIMSGSLVLHLRLRGGI